MAPYFITKATFQIVPSKLVFKPKNGHKVILCTGRQRIEIFGPMLEIDYDAIIAGSGATIECEHKIVEENALTKEESQYLSNYLLTNHIPANFESSTGIYATQYTKDTMLKMVEEQCAGKVKKKAKHGLTILTSQITVVDNLKDLIYNKVSVIDNGKTPYKKNPTRFIRQIRCDSGNLCATRKRKWRNHFLPHQ